MKGTESESQQSPDFLPIIVTSQFRLFTVPAIFSTRWSWQIQFVTEKATFFIFLSEDIFTKVVNPVNWNYSKTDNSVLLDKIIIAPI